MINKRVDRIDAVGKVFFVGDIHGHYDSLMGALDNINFNARNGDILISVGDIIDGGEGNEDALELLNEDWFYAVMGNHELMMLDAVSCLTEKEFDNIKNFLIDEQGLGKALKFSNGQLSICDEVELKNNLTIEQINWVINRGWWFFVDKLQNKYAGQMAIVEKLKKRALPLGIDLHFKGNRFGVVHAEIPTDTWQQFVEDVSILNRPSSVLYKRRKIDAYFRGLPVNGTFVPDIKSLIVGHTIMDNLDGLMVGNTYYIDVGAKITGKVLIVDASSLI